ncbi:sterile alpha motif domain-containing protein 1 [Aplochiton taeniatus]
MSETKYRDWILETIDSLRSRKARPDLERICRMVRRRHGSDPDRTRAELEKLIQEQTVLKVSYKGSISYRNAAKVQRKSRKKTEFTPGDDREAARERTKQTALNNNGDSAHSLTDQEEGDESGDKEDWEHSPDPLPQTLAVTPDEKPKTGPNSGNACLICGATTVCADGCCVEKTSVPGDKGLGHQTGYGCLSPDVRTNAHEKDVICAPQNKAIIIQKGKEPALSVEEDSSGVKAAADMETKTCPESASSDSNLSRRQKSFSLKPKLRVGGGDTKAMEDQANSDLGDRLVASVRSLSERYLLTGTVTATKGHIKPLGLKEILGYLSSQDRLSVEKLTRSKVKVVLEREVAKGRLRRTRCGNITLPLRGMVVEESVTKPAPAARLLKSALQDRHVVNKVDEPMERDSVKEELKEVNEDNGSKESTQTAGSEEGRSPIPMELENSLEKSQSLKAVKQENAQQPHFTNGPLVDAACPTDVASGPHSAPVEESAIDLDRLQKNSQLSGLQLSLPDQREGRSKEEAQASSAINNSCCKSEVGVSSCLLTPTASPREPGLLEEQGMNGGMFVKSEGACSPVNWTISDVVSYFTAAGFPEQALAFRTQEIDGKSLLLMHRNDVLTGLSIRLGPALKIYERHVKVLQKTHFEDDDC